MAQFKADRRIKDKETGNVYKAGEEFEMTIKRKDELKKNIKNTYGVDVKFTRLDVPDDKEDEQDEEEAVEEEGE